MMKAFLLALVLALQASQVVLALELTQATWEEQAAGKEVFIKFFAPWCGHCKKMKPDWDMLMKTYENNFGLLVAEVDCDGEGKSLCQSQKIEGFPTIMYGDIHHKLVEYEGPRDSAALLAFTKDTLLTTCSMQNWEHCDESEEKALKQYVHISMEELEKLVADPESQHHEHYRLMRKALAHRQMMASFSGAAQKSEEL